MSENAIAEKAERLVKVAHLVVIELPVDLADRVPAMAALLRTTSLDDWDFFGTIAGVAAGVLAAPWALPRSDGEIAIRLVHAALEGWHEQAPGALQDLLRFVRRGAENGGDLDTGIGLWLIWNVKRAKPSAEEAAVAPAIGRLLRAATGGCWD